MMNFDAAVALLLPIEGSYSNNRNDPGKETMWGITSATARRNGYKGDMRILSKTIAIEIYRRVYWDPQHIDDFPEPIRYPLFDCCVNEGVERALEFINSILSLSEESFNEVVTVAAGVADPWSITCDLMALRVRHYTSLPTWGAFGRGWMNRIATNLEVIANLKGEA